MSGSVAWRDRLEALERLSHKNKVRFIMKFVEVERPAPMQLNVDTVNRWLNDDITSEECRSICNHTPFLGVPSLPLLVTYSPDVAKSVIADNRMFLDHAARESLMRYLWELNVQQDLEDVLFKAHTA